MAEAKTPYLPKTGEVVQTKNGETAVCVGYAKSPGKAKKGEPDTWPLLVACHAHHPKWLKPATLAEEAEAETEEAETEEEAA